MASFNRVILVGNLTGDPEIRYIPDGKAVTDLRLAIKYRYKNAGGEWVDDTTFVDVTLWGRTAEVAGEYLSKGSPVFIEGRLKYDAWETPEGDKRSKLKVVCERMQLLPTGGAGGQSGQSGQSGQGAQGAPRGGGPSVQENQYNQPPPQNDYGEPPGDRGGGGDIAF